MKSCPCCGVKMVRGGNLPQTRSKDHIIPITRGGNGVRWNLRYMCKRCNHHRALAGHCLGALACARAVAQDDPFKTRKILRKWAFTQR